MCNDDLEPADFYTSKMVRARRDRKCVECGAAIRVGDTYERDSGKWDGEVRSFATCARCCRVRESFQKRQAHYCAYAFGSLIESIREHQSEAAATARWRAANPGWRERGYSVAMTAGHAPRSAS